MVYTIYKGTGFSIKWRITRKGRLLPLDFRLEGIRVKLFVCTNGNMTPLNFEITDKGEVSLEILANSFGVGVYNLYLIWEDKASKKGEAFEKEAFILTDDVTDTDSNGCYYFNTEVPCVAMDGLSAYDLYVLNGGGLTLQEWILSTVSSAKNELDRIVAEKERIAAESTRKTQEESRVINENTRILSENDRTAKEIARVSAENNREIQEKARKSSTDTALSNVNAAISNVNNLAELVSEMFTYGYLFSNILTSIEQPDFVGSIGKYFCITQIPGVYTWANSTEVNEGEIAFLVYSKDTETSTATWQKGSIKNTVYLDLNSDARTMYDLCKNNKSGKIVIIGVNETDGSETFDTIINHTPLSVRISWYEGMVFYSIVLTNTNGSIVKTTEFVNLIK